MSGDGPHKKRGHAISYLPDALIELSGEEEWIGEGPEPLELRKRETPALRPVHCAVHAEVAIVAPDSARWLPRVELHGIESLSRDVGLGRPHAYPIPELERPVLSPRLEESRQLLLRRNAAR